MTRFLTGIFVIIIFSSTGFSQQPSIANELNAAAAFATNGNYAKAKASCASLLQKHPENLDVKILLGRIYSWTDQYDSARYYLSQVLNKDTKYESALSALANVELWSGHPQLAIMYCDSALRHYPKSEGFYLKKAKALRKENKLRAAKRTTEDLLKIGPENKDGLKLLAVIKEELLVNRAGLFYNYDIFSITYAPWNFVSIYLARQTRVGTVLGSINYSNRFGQSGLQYEADFYPKITKNLSAYLNAGFSNDSVFPRLRLGSSLYYRLPFKTEIELGLRYLQYPDIGDATLIYTGSVSKYVNRFWFSFRPFLTSKTNGFSQIYYLSFRYYYLKEMNSYVTATFSSGRNPYDYYTSDSLSNQAITTYSLQSKRIKLDLYAVIKKRNVIKVSVAYDQREYNVNKFRDHGIFGLGYERLF